MVAEKNVHLPRRSKRYGIGKAIGGNVYLHRRYESLLGPPLESARGFIPPDFFYTVVKYNLPTGNVSFIHSRDFDTSPEPIAGDTWTVTRAGKATFRLQAQEPWIYHHKWLMVTDDYTGFNVEESKARSRAWLALPDVDRSRIGRQSFWLRNVIPRLP